LLHTGVFEYVGQRHATPDGVADGFVTPGDFSRHIGKCEEIGTSVARTLECGFKTDLRQLGEFGQRKTEGSVHKPVDQQLVFIRVDLGDRRMVPHKE
jgi:hypothetical protein